MQPLEPVADFKHQNLKPAPGKIPGPASCDSLCRAPEVAQLVVVVDFDDVWSRGDVDLVLTVVHSNPTTAW